MTDASLILSFRKNLRSCTTCPIHANTGGPIPWSGDINPQYAVLGEAPGKTEASRGEPFCLWEGHKVLMADLTWKPLGELQVGDMLLAPDEYPQPTPYASASNFDSRRWRVTPVLNVTRSKKPTLALETESGTLYLTPDHKVLAGKSRHWIEASRLAFKGRRSSLNLAVHPWQLDTSREAGWLAGFFDGEGHLGVKKRDAAYIHIGFAQNQGFTSDYAQKLLVDKGFWVYNNGESRHNGVVCERVQIRGGLREMWRFLGEVRPQRLLNRYLEQILPNHPPSLRTGVFPLLDKRADVERDVVDITTGTGTFIADGFVVHNCGDTGNILRHWLKQVGIDPDKVAYLNSVACWPARSPATPTADEISACRPWMHGQLEFIRPQILITLGVVAWASIRKGSRWPKLQAVHGKPWFHPTYHFSVFSTYHPAAYLRGRNKTYEKKITDCLKSVAAWDGRYLEECAVCGGELYRYDEDGFPYCQRHAARQMGLFPEDVTA